MLRELVSEAKDELRHYPLVSQMRVRAGEDYIGWIRSILRPGPPDVDAPPPAPRTFQDYDLQFFDDLGEMHDAIRARDAEHGLARLVAGYAWPWVSKGNADIMTSSSMADFSVGTAPTPTGSHRPVRWRKSVRSTRSRDTTSTTPASSSVETLSGIREADRLLVNRKNYFDKKGKENNPTLGRKYSDEDLLRYICNVYAVLLTRGIRGTYVYVCDEALRLRLSGLLPSNSARVGGIN